MTLRYVPVKEGAKWAPVNQGVEETSVLLKSSIGLLSGVRKNDRATTCASNALV